MISGLKEPVGIVSLMGVFRHGLHILEGVIEDEDVLAEMRQDSEFIAMYLDSQVETITMNVPRKRGDGHDE